MSSINKSNTRYSTSPHESHAVPVYQQPQYSYTSETTSPTTAQASVNASFTSSTPPTRTRDRALDVSTILNPSPRPTRPRVAPYDATRRPSLVQSPTSPANAASYHAGVSMRRAPSTPSLTSPGPIRGTAQPRRSLPVITSDPFPRITSPGPQKASPLRVLNTPPPSTLPPPHSPPQQYTYGTQYGTSQSSASVSPSGYNSSLGPSAFSSTAPQGNFSSGRQSLGGALMEQMGGSSGQSPLGMAMSVPGGHGYFSIPIDTESGGRVKSEKRRKNAEASNRFRRRKKERELQTTARVTELEQKVKKAEEETNYHRQKHEYYRQILVRAHQDGGRLPPLPPEILRMDDMQSTYGNEERDRRREVAPSGQEGGMGFSSSGDARMTTQSPRTANFSGLVGPYHHHQRAHQQQIQQQQPHHHQLPPPHLPPPTYHQQDQPPRSGLSHGRGRSA
ncbi:hypothetical protein FPQ18DRAFT_112588 [Pyronema domesticum]|uniref:BZIP domain-containing protein n=1 Tax=Pyronema omphalodes (strain CBS 100304) TaxID=1076935 RepID=U4LRY5_PYROM|nr:hypothetical protein FPQ18DRAFT_112588 [Pyronema domesticum]CCX30061.1 Similar to hypothetical protein LEMA_P116620.1 [Leptosphaeria maculans JN3]; acc. no. CBX94659 [Pyronema omphalodes CBS 100304]